MEFTVISENSAGISLDDISAYNDRSKNSADVSLRQRMWTSGVVGLWRELRVLFMLTFWCSHREIEKRRRPDFFSEFYFADS